MATLPLAVAIADSVLEAGELNTPIEVDAKANQLLDEHPEADATHEDVLDALVEESASHGVDVQFGLVSSE